MKEGRSNILLVEQVKLEPRVSKAPKEDLKRIVSKFKEAFSDQPQKTMLTENDIELTCEEPIRSKPHRCSPIQKQIIADEIQCKCKLKLEVT